MKKYHIKNARGKLAGKLSCRHASMSAVGAVVAIFAGSKMQSYLWLPPGWTIKRVKR